MGMDEQMTFGDWLKRTREAQGYSKVSLSKASGVDRAHIHRIEKGEILLPEAATRARLHKVFGTNDDELVTAGIVIKREYPRPDGSTVVEYDPAYAPMRFARMVIGRPDERGNIVPTEETFGADLPAHLRASFHKLEELTPERQRRIIDMIEEQAILDELQRERLRRDEE